MVYCNVKYFGNSLYINYHIIYGVTTQKFLKPIIILAILNVKQKVKYIILCANPNYFKTFFLSFSIL